MKDFKDTITFVDVKNKIIGGSFKAEELKEKQLDKQNLKDYCTELKIDYLGDFK